MPGQENVFHGTCILVSKRLLTQRNDSCSKLLLEAPCCYPYAGCLPLKRWLWTYCSRNLWDFMVFSALRRHLASMWNFLKRTQERKQLRARSYCFSWITFRVIPLASLGLSWLKPEFYQEFLQTQEFLEFAAHI